MIPEYVYIFLNRVNLSHLIYFTRFISIDISIIRQLIIPLAYIQPLFTMVF